MISASIRKLYLFLVITVFVHEPRDEAVRLSAVGLELRVALVFPLKEWYPAHISDQERDEQRRVNCDIAIWNGACDQVDSPPEDRLAEVVWVSRVAPQAPLDELRLAHRFICQVLLELLIADPFEKEAEQPDCNAQVVAPDQRRACGVNLDIEGRRVVDKREEPLHHENYEECTPKVSPVSADSRPISSKVLIAEVFPFVAKTNVEGKAQRPNRHQRKHNPCACVRLSATLMEPLKDQGNNREDKGKSPHHIDEAIVLLPLAPEEEKEIADKNDSYRNVKVIGVDFGHFYRF